MRCAVPLGIDGSCVKVSEKILSISTSTLLISYSKVNGAGLCATLCCALLLPMTNSVSTAVRVPVMKATRVIRFTPFTRSTLIPTTVAISITN